MTPEERRILDLKSRPALPEWIVTAVWHLNQREHSLHRALVELQAVEHEEMAYRAIDNENRAAMQGAAKSILKAIKSTQKLRDAVLTWKPTRNGMNAVK